MSDAVSRLSLLPEGSAQLLDRYQLIGEIASGGMASVFLARLPGAGGFSRLVAIKRLHPHLAGERDFVEMFLDEARLAASIHHRNVVPILEIGSSFTGYYLVMEYIEGVTLAKLMTQATVTRNQVPRSVLLRVMVDTLSGLHAAHELNDEHEVSLGVVHRDCSPQNILIGLDGCTRITDFGIARARSRLHNTREGSMKGKLAYMAPEQTQGDRFDRRADLFSVGVVLWEILAEARLFKGTTEAETLKRLLHDPIPPLRNVVTDIAPALDAVCNKALARQPEARFATAAEMADAIETAARQSGAPIASEREIEALMKERYGAEAMVQRDVVRSWLQATPTTIGARGTMSDPGWMGRDRSAVGPRPHAGGPPVSSRVPATGRGWPPESSDEALSGFEGETTHLVDEPEAETIEAPRKRPPPPPMRASAEETETTNIYDPPSSTGAVFGVPPAEMSAPVFSDPKPSLPMQRSRGRGLLVVAALLAVGTAAVLMVRSTTRADIEAPTVTAPREVEERAAQPEPSDVTPAPPIESAAPSALPEMPTATPTTTARVEPRPPPRPVSARRPSAPTPKVAATPEPKEKPKSPPRSDEIDDLSNPYR